MCSYCGCEAEPVVAQLMSEHTRIADLAYGVERALDDGRADDAARLCARLAEMFTAHSFKEESGLFMQLRRAGEATVEVDRLTSEHRRLRPALSAPDVAGDPARLRRLLDELARHAEMEDSDLFPFAMQQLPDDAWGALSTA